MKTLNEMMLEAQMKQAQWLEIADDPQALLDRNKSRCQALMLANYFEGKYDGLNAFRLNNTK